MVVTNLAQALREANAEAIAAARHATPHLVDHNGYDMIEVLHRPLASRSHQPHDLCCQYVRSGHWRASRCL